jgi:hypothetical protein
MTFPDAIKMLVGAPVLAAVRTRGPIVVMTDRQRLVDLRGRKPRRYVGKFSDYVAMDWQIVTPEQLREIIAKTRAAD